MEKEPVERIEEQVSGEPPEDVAILYSWANLQGARYRDFSADRREYRAQLRQRVAGERELAEPHYRSHAEDEALRAEAEAVAVKFEDQTRRAASEQTGGAHRVELEATAFPDTISRREEREFHEEPIASPREAAQYYEFENRNRQRAAQENERSVPGEMSDPYSQQALPKSEFFESPEEPLSDLQPGHPKSTRDYMERSTGADLSEFPIPGSSFERSHQGRVVSGGASSLNVLPDPLIKRRSVREPPNVEVVNRISDVETSRTVGGTQGEWPALRQEGEFDYPSISRRDESVGYSETIPGVDKPDDAIPVQAVGPVRPQWLRPNSASFVDEEHPPVGIKQAERSQADSSHAKDVLEDLPAPRWFTLKGIFGDSAETSAAETARENERHTPIIAVYSMAGGVGKTSLVATLGRALSSLGERVLLMDTTSFGLLPFYYGANTVKPGVVRTFLPPSGSPDIPLHIVTYDTEGKGGDSKAQSEIAEDLLANAQQVNRLLMDINLSCGWLIERFSALKPTILVPLAADINSAISLRAVERLFAAMHDSDGEPLRPQYLLNQFDASLPLHLDLQESLRQQLGDRLLPFVIRKGAGVSEALAEGMTIIDYNPESVVSQDYMTLAKWVRETSAPANTGLRNLRWSER